MTGYRLAPGVAWVDVAKRDPTIPAGEPRAVAARVPDGPPVALHGSSAVIWISALGGGDTEDVIRRVVAATGEDRSLVADPVTEFLHDLVARGLLTRD